MELLYENIGTIVTIIIAMGATYAAMSAKLSKLETLMEDSQKLQKAHETTWLAKEDAVHQEIVGLRRDVEKHNNVIERTYGLEADMKAVQVDVSNIKSNMDKGAA